MKGSTDLMKPFVYLITCILILSIGSLFVLKSPTGKPWLKVSDFFNPQAITKQANDFKTTVINKTKAVMKNDSDPTIYKWQDEQGVWHYSDSQQANGKEWVKPNNLTVIPAIKPLNKEEVVEKSPDKELTQMNSTNGNKITQLINDTQNIQQIMNDRTKQIDEQLK